MRYSLERLGLLVPLLVASAASAVTIDWTPIGVPGNAADPQRNGLIGSVGYDYSIGTYEVTNAQYAEFLNAKAVSDPYGLYDPNMGDPTSPQFAGGIGRSGGPGSYSYAPLVGRENMPVNFVSVYSAMRFANWMNNGQGSSNTESGAYTLLGGTATPSNGTTVVRNPGATIVLPTENEWYKAAYFNPSSGSYFLYPAGSNTATACAVPTAAPNSANCRLAVGDLTTVGSYPGSASPFGTFDQGGNVFEWSETILPPMAYRYAPGGSFDEINFYLASVYEPGFDPQSRIHFLGIRLAMIPEPDTGLLVSAGLVGLAVRRRERT
jgi:formylglycine-generating enzyme required for sulfatase activity